MIRSVASSRSEGEDSTRVLIAEHQELLGEGLAAVLDRAPDVSVVGIARTAAEAIALGERARPHVILLDPGLPSGGAAVATRLLELVRNVALLMLLDSASEDAMLSAVEAGASGVLLKSESGANVLKAVRQTAAGEMLFRNADLAGLIQLQKRNSWRATERARLLQLLTPRELEVLELMTAGLDNRAISRELVVSYTTARMHVQSLLSKLRAHSRLEAVAIARDYQLLQ